MKPTVLFFIICIAIIATSCKTTKQSSYNKKLAEQLGADEYGMRTYQLVILKTGKTIINDKDSVSKIFRGHLDNITKLADAGKLIIAGPFGKNDHNFRGLYIFKTNKAETETLLQTDPAIRSGLLTPEVYPWYGSAALEMYLPYSKQIEKVAP
ncbi:MAG: YciI family protein [Niabella sp.]